MTNCKKECREQLLHNTDVISWGEGGATLISVIMKTDKEKKMKSARFIPAARYLHRLTLIWPVSLRGDCGHCEQMVLVTPTRFRERTFVKQQLIHKYMNPGEPRLRRKGYEEGLCPPAPVCPSSVGLSRLGLMFLSAAERTREYPLTVRLLLSMGQI